MLYDKKFDGLLATITEVVSRDKLKVGDKVEWHSKQQGTKMTGFVTKVHDEKVDVKTNVGVKHTVLLNQLKKV
jgi:preprotein translocase subunit YajC